MTQTPTPVAAGPHIREEFMITRQGKQYVLFAGLLDAAHARGLQSITTELIKLGMEGGEPTYAVVKAVVLMDDATKFEGIGDATQKNVGKNIAPHLIRMAETRAKARALRDAINVGATALEEISEDEHESSNPKPSPRSARSNGATNGSASAASAPPGTILKSQVARIEKLSSELWGNPRAVQEKVLRGVAIEDLTAELAAKCITGLMNAQDKKKAQKGDEQSKDDDGEEKAGPGLLHVLNKLSDELYANKEEHLSGSEWLSREIGKPFYELTAEEAQDLIDQVEEEGISTGLWVEAGATT